MGYSNKKENTLLYLVHLVLCKLAATIPVMILVIIAEANFYDTVGGYNSLIENWKAAPILEIESTSGGCSKGYEPIFQGDWPGTVSGCNCLHVSCRRKGVRSFTLSRGTCSVNATLCGCRNVHSTPSKMLWKWPGEVKYCGFIAPELSFLNNYQNTHLDGSCYQGYKKCGNINGVGKGICIKDSYTKCPISSIKFSTVNPEPTTSSYHEIVGTILNLYYSRETTQKLVVDAILSEQKVCLSTYIKSTSKGRSEYVLIAKDTENDCEIDPRYSEAGQEIGEMNLFNENQVDYHDLPAFRTSNSYKWKKFTRKMIEFSPICRAFVPEIINFQQNIKSIHSILKAAFWISILTSIAVAVGGSLEVYFLMEKTDESTWYYLSQGIRSLLSLIMLILLFVLYGEGKRGVGFFLILVMNNAQMSLQIITLSQWMKISESMW